MGSGSVWEQPFRIENKQFIHTVRENLLLHLTFDACSGNNGMEFHTQFVGELAALGEQILRYFGNGSAFDLAIYKYVIHKILVHRF